MRLGTSTNIVYMRPNGARMPLEETLRMGAEAGFGEFDFNSYDWSLPGAKLWDDDWEYWIYSIAEAADKYGVRFSQSHAYVYDFLNPAWTTEELEKQEEMVERSLRCLQILGAKVAVTHVSTEFLTVKPMEASKKANMEYYNRYLEKYGKYNLDIALENQWDLDIAPRRKYGSTTEELADLVDSINDARVGICWDFEHGDLMRADQARDISFIGKRLKATHVSDHYGWSHPHIMPLFGNINWEPIMRSLRSIDYRGVFSYEAHNYTNRFPDSLLPTALKLSFEIGEYLISLADGPGYDDGWNEAKALS